MFEIIFAKPAHEYGTHVDFWRLVELSGFPIIPLSEIDPQSDNVYLYTPNNGENQNGWQNPRARIIHYALEWNLDGKDNTPPGVTDVWCGDKAHAEKYHYKYVPLGSHPGLNEYPNLPKVSEYNRYDVAFMGYKDVTRRARVLHDLYESGVRIAPNGWGQVRSADLLDSKCMIAIHQWDNLAVLPPLRMCIAAAHKLTVITETVEDAGIFQHDIIQWPYEQLAHMTRLIVRDQYQGAMLRALGEQLFQKLCVDFTFRQSIERAL